MLITLYAVLARLQQLTTIGLIGAAFGWAAYALAISQPVLAVGGAVLILFGYAIVLGIEFVLMQSANRLDPYPRARTKEVLAAWGGEIMCGALVFCWRQPFRADAFADQLTGKPGQRGLVLVHGFVCNRGLWNAWYPRLIERGIPFVGVNLEPIFGQIDDYALQVEAAVEALHRSTGLAPVVVAHSMGGLAVRAWLRATGPSVANRVHHVVTLGTPHAGTSLARFGFSPNSRQMISTGLWLDGLKRFETSGVFAGFTCVFSNCDNIVFPASTAVLANSQAVHIPACAHVQMADHPRAFETVMHWLVTDHASSDAVAAPELPARQDEEA